MVSEQPEFLTIAEVAALLRVSKISVYRAAESGELPGLVRVGKLLRVRRAVLLGLDGSGRVA